MSPGDRLVCALVEPQAEGVQFRQWLLHVTIVPWFRLDGPSESIAQGIHRALHGIEPFRVTGRDEALFGPHRNRPVRLLQQSTQLADIERRVRTYLHQKRAWLVDETTKRRQQFRPHVTMQGREGLRRGDTFVLDALYIVEQKGDYKEIVSKVEL